MQILLKLYLNSKHRLICNRQRKSKILILIIHHIGSKSFIFLILNILKCMALKFQIHNLQSIASVRYLLTQP